ncbi:MAG: uracil-DNA glycosylase [Spirochaetota bacterium]
MKITKKQYLKHKLLNLSLELKNSLYQEKRFTISKVELNKKQIYERQTERDNRTQDIEIHIEPAKRKEKETNHSLNNLRRSNKLTENKADRDDNLLFSFPDTEYRDENKFIRLRDKALTCTACALSQTRNNVVFGEGNPTTEVMIIGEGPGADEDKFGRPFVGKAGKLLSVMLNAIGLNRQNVYITNIVKCRPPRNRDPFDNEIKICTPYLKRQIELINPKIIITLGNFASKFMINTKKGITFIRGQKFIKDNKIIIPTYHPSFLLRNPIEKLKAWKDLQIIRITIDKECKKGS